MNSSSDFLQDIKHLRKEVGNWLGKWFPILSFKAKKSRYREELVKQGVSARGLLCDVGSYKIVNLGAGTTKGVWSMEPCTIILNSLVC